MADEFRRRMNLALEKGTVNAKQTVRAKITHQEDQCGLWHGRGQCDCDPQIIVGTPQGEFNISAKGYLEGIG